MKKFLAGVATLAMVAGGASSVMAQSTATNNATATLEQAVEVTAGDDLLFGTVLVSGGSETVIIATDGTPTGTASSSGTQQNATFDVTGGDTATYTITLPADGDVVMSGPGAETIPVNSFVSDPSGTGALTSGAQTINVGATLAIAGGETVGAYSATFDVTVENN